MNEPLLPTRVWDLPTRVFHWVLACCVVGSVISAKIGGNAMVWHMRLGYVVFTLLAFRLVWGLIGGRWSRFASFIYSPAAVLRANGANNISGFQTDFLAYDGGVKPAGFPDVTYPATYAECQPALVGGDPPNTNAGPRRTYNDNEDNILVCDTDPGEEHLIDTTLVVLVPDAIHAAIDNNNVGGVTGTDAPDASLAASDRASREVVKAITSFPETEFMWSLTANWGGFGGLVAKDWNERSRSTAEMYGEVYGRVSQVPGVRVFPRLDPPLPTPGQYDVELVLQSELPPEQLLETVGQVLGAGWQSPCGRWRLNAGYLFMSWYNVLPTDQWIRNVQTNDFVDDQHDNDGHAVHRRVRRDNVDAAAYHSAQPHAIVGLLRRGGERAEPEQRIACQRGTAAGTG